MEFLRKHFALLVLGAVLVVGSYILGFNSGEESISKEVTALENMNEGRPGSVDFAPFWRAWNILEEKYVPASTTVEQVTNQEKVWGAIEGLASSLGDPYTVFFPPVESEMFQADIRGNFEGVGMEVATQDGVVTVIAPLKGSPAERAGVLAGDKVIRVGDKDTRNLTTEDAVQLIRGPKGTTVTLTIVRSGVKESFEIKIVRDTIDIPTISTELLANNIFKIELYSFSAQSPNLFRNALREFIQSGSNRLILDLRGNPGGYLEAAIDMASWFLAPSKVIVREDFGGTQEEKIYRSKGYDVFNDNLKFVILIDKGSASASEILAGALQEHGEATLVGDTTFGKGSVQELVDITTETSLKVTIARWLTPNGASISEAGVEPDFKVPYTAADREADRDPQLQKAIEVLSQ